MEAADELYKQMIPDLNSTLPAVNPTWTQMAALGVKLKGAVLMGHSESGFFPEQAALIDPSGIRGNISIEMPCATDLTAAQIGTLAKIPTLIMFGDHLGDVTGGPANWAQSFATLQDVRRSAEEGGRRRRDDAPARRWASKATATCSCRTGTAISSRISSSHGSTSTSRAGKRAALNERGAGL